MLSTPEAEFERHVMKATPRVQPNLIFSEGLRLVSQCRVPQFCSSVESDQLLQVQQEWARSLLQKLPPLMDWAERHRNTLFDGEKCGPVMLEFQQCFVLVYLEQGTDLRILGFQLDYRDNEGLELVHRLLQFEKDVERILAKDTNTDLRSSLFHYFESALGLQGWQSHPVELHSFHRLVCFLREDIIFGQGLMLFAVNIAKELLGFQQDFEHQKTGIDLLCNIMKLPDSERSYSEDAEDILKMSLCLTRQIANTLYDDQVWDIIYGSLRSIRGANLSLDDEVMQHLLTLWIEQIKEKSSKLVDGETSLRTLTLLLLLDVPEVEIKSFNFEDITISGRQCNWHELLSYSRNHLQNADPDNLRYSIDTRIRIGRLIPKLFSTSYFMHYSLFEYSNLRLDLLTWVTMFPIGQTEQQKLALGLMLKRSLDKIKRLCRDVVRHRTHYALSQFDVLHLYDMLRDPLRVFSQGIYELPSLVQFRKLKWDLKERMIAARVEIKRLNRLVIREEEQGDDEEQ